MEEAAQVMQDRQIRRIPIINHDNELVGIVSLGDVAVKGTHKGITAEALEQISQRPHCSEKERKGSPILSTETHAATKNSLLYPDPLRSAFLEILLVRLYWLLLDRLSLAKQNA